MNNPQNVIEGYQEAEEKNTNKEFLKKINKEIRKIKEAYNDPLDGVLTYDNKGVCTSFFDSTIEITEDILLKKETEIAVQINRLEEIKQTINDNNDLGPTAKTIYRNSIEGVINKFKMFKNAIRLEATKSGYILDKETSKAKTAEVIKYQKLAYGERVSDTPNEIKSVINRLYEKMGVDEKNTAQLTEIETKHYKDFLKTMEEKFGVVYDAEVEKDKIKKEEKSERLKTHQDNKVVDKKKIKKYSDRILNIYKDYFTENYDITRPKRKTVYNKEKKNLYVSGKENIEIPNSYANISEEHMTKVVIGHEMEQHLFLGNNTNRLLGEGFIGNGYDLVAEGVAKINEAIASGEVNNLEDLKKLKETAGLGMAATFICENYNYDDAVEILRIYHKLGKWKDESECLEKAKNNVQRRKRFFESGEPGSSIKETLYDRGKNEIIDRLTEDNDLAHAIEKYKDYDFLKLGKDEILLIPELKKELGINDNQIIYTLMISRVLNDKLVKGVGSAKEYMNPLNMKSINYTAKRELVEVLKDMKSLLNPPTKSIK